MTQYNPMTDVAPIPSHAYMDENSLLTWAIASVSAIIIWMVLAWGNRAGMMAAPVWVALGLAIILLGCSTPDRPDRQTEAAHELVDFTAARDEAALDRPR